MKQQQIEDAFKDWIWKDPTRRQMLVKEYNERFNSLRPREYDGSHILFHGMSPEITLRPHQKNAIAHILYGGNTLLAHVVGAGKTYEMVAAAMEKKRLGLCSKTLICVPNHLTEQLAGEALQLYPNANILVARKTDFEKANRKRFCAKIATGNYDIIIIGHSQFERIPLSQERQVEYLQSQIHDVINQVAQLKEERAENFTVKQMERMRKQLEKKLDKLNDQSRKDDVVTFEQLGVDSLMVDEAHAFKNLAVLSKMRNVAGISQTESQRASDLYMKCRYLDEITGSRGVVFATGTPISNSMAELFTMQRYLQRETLEQHGLSSFDAWASTFGETVTAVELAPEGTGYRTKTRFSKFYNLPELMSMFKQVADVQTADMLNLPVPKLVGGKPINVALPPSPQQKQMVADLADRAEEIRAGNVDPTEDNMLKVTNDGRKLALDQRLIDPNLPENPNDKVHACAENVYRIWSETKDKRLTQLVFCDLSTPKPDGFNVYDDLRNLLITMGIPENEVQFIHSANTEVKKAELFAKVRSGDVRVLMGSTGKMGAGTNVQRLLVATHHLDCGWKPSDIEQRNGRMIRQGNTNAEVYEYRYVTESSFDSYMWQLLETKQKFIGQIMTSKSPARSADDLDDAALSYAEVKALAAGNPMIKEKMDLDIQVARLKTLKTAYNNEHYRLEDAITQGFPAEMRKTAQQLENAKADTALLQQNTKRDADGKDIFTITLMDTVYTKREDAGKALLGLLGMAMNRTEPVSIGRYKGFDLQIAYFAMDMILECKVSEDSYDENRMDILFGELEQRDPHHPAVLQYRSFKLGSAKTLSSIMVTAVSNLHMLQSAAFAEMIATDEMFLPKLGMEKRAIFCVIPDNDDTFNFMVSILYTQLFDQLFRLADSTPEFHGTLPVHVRLMMDEFANVATPENFVKILAVARSRNISCDIILQNISQIKSKYKDDWETIIGNCDSLVYLGGNDYSTFEYISKLLGKQTIRTKGQSIGKGSHGSSSDSYQVTGRELMTPDEVRRMKRSDCLVMISGEAPVRDKKYNLFDHPNLKYTPDYRSPRGLLHRFATPIPAPEGYTMPPDYMAQAGTVSLAYVAELTCPEITEDLYDELQELEESLL